LEGSLRILSSKTGTVIEAQVPLSHMLPPEQTATLPGDASSVAPTPSPAKKASA